MPKRNPSTFTQHDRVRQQCELSVAHILYTQCVSCIIRSYKDTDTSTGDQQSTHFASKWLRVFAFSSNKFCFDLRVSIIRHLED